MTPTIEPFLLRHLGVSMAEQEEMLQYLGLTSLDELIDQTIPKAIRLTQKLPIGEAMSESEYLQFIRHIMDKNQRWKNYIGMGYYGTHTPTVIQRNIFENPGWYTQYTPYQAEIAQGRLEALLNFQTMVSDLTALPIANASLLDEATAAAEAMQLLFRSQNKSSNTIQRHVFWVSDQCFPSTLAVLQTRANPLNIDLRIVSPIAFEYTEDSFGYLVQYPNNEGAIENYSDLAIKIHAIGAGLVVATDLLSLCLLQAPGEWGADIVVGNSQRFGVPLGYGGPHAAFFATQKHLERQIPGRIIGVSIDKHQNRALRMALQTREQHIRRDKATSNICTAQALLAIMSSMYAVYHGATGLKNIAQRVHHYTVLLYNSLTSLGYDIKHEHFFDTLLIDLANNPNTSALRIKRVAVLDQINFRYFDNDEEKIGIAIDETTTISDIKRIINIFAEAADIENTNIVAYTHDHIPTTLQRQSKFLTHEVFCSHHSETQMLRYIKSLEQKDLSLAFSMIPLGSCTMKLNATTQMIPISFANFSQIHPFVPLEQTKGYQQIFQELEQYLCQITGFSACSLQPNSGAQGEYAGLMVIRAYHQAQGNEQRKIALIPQSAHGTNPASAVMSGMDVVVVKCDAMGNIDLQDLQTKAEQYADKLSCLMVTYPSTHGVYEEDIVTICDTIHRYGGQVYMDGANMNAQVGLTNPATIGADVCHLNLHKTFAIPHGGGGPGMGPICVAEHLVNFLPTHPYTKTIANSQAVSAVAAAPWGSASILLISYAYIRLLGTIGLQRSTEIAILNANYIKNRLSAAFPILYVGKNNRVAHELIIDIRPFKQSANIEAEDIAKRLMDYGFHAPTVSFPVAGTLMIEPTESESKEELDRFCDAMINIRSEIAEIESKQSDPIQNVLKNAPHTIAEVTNDEWHYNYSRQKAAYPLPYLKKHKFWASVGRINNTYGDRNLVCTCLPLEDYQ